MSGSRKDQYRVTVSVDRRDLGTWDTFAGGGVDSDEQKYKPGGMEPEISLGGQQTVNNFTVGRLYDLNRDHSIIKWLIGRAGKGTAVAKKQPLDVDGNPFGDPLVYRGIIKTVTPPETDSNANDPALVTMEVSSAGTVG